MNTILLMVLSSIICFAAVALVDKFFGKKGLFALTPVLLIIANIGSSKIATLFGDFTTTLGIPAFAAMFLITDILNEKYSKKDANKAVMLAILGEIFFMACIGIEMLYTPAVFDAAQEPMKALFSINFRVTIASLVMFAISNFADIWLYDLLKKKGAPLWLRNNVATIVCNCLENFIFLTLAFIGTMPLGAIMTSAVVCSILEAGVAVLDTPFLYLTKKWGAIEE